MVDCQNFVLLGCQVLTFLKSSWSPQSRDRVTLLCSLHNRVPVSERVSLGCSTSSPQFLQRALYFHVFPPSLPYPLLSRNCQIIKLSKMCEQVLCLVGLFSEAFRQNLKPRKNLCTFRLVSRYNLGVKVVWSGRCLFTLGPESHKDHSITALKMATFGLLPILRFFLGYKCIVCAHYRFISLLKGLIVCSFCSETFISLHNFLVLYCSWWLGMEVLHPLVPISSDGLTSVFSFMQFSQQEGSDTGIMEGENNASALSTSEQKCENYEGECQLFCSNSMCTSSSAPSLVWHIELCISKMLEEGVGRLIKTCCGI